MNQKPLVIIRKNSVSLTPHMLDMSATYIRYVISIYRKNMEEYQRAVDPNGDYIPEGNPQHDEHIAVVETEIARAENLVHDLELLKQELNRYYSWNFEQLADLLCQIRIHFNLENIFDMYSLKVVMVCLMQMLKQANPTFNREKFINRV